MIFFMFLPTKEVFPSWWSFGAVSASFYYPFCGHLSGKLDHRAFLQISPKGNRKMLLFTAIGYGIFEGFSTGIYQGHMPGIWAVILGIGCLGLCLGSLVYWAVSALVRACQGKRRP